MKSLSCSAVHLNQPDTYCINVIQQGQVYLLTFTTLRVISADKKLTILFSYFSWKTGFDISCKLSPEESICMKHQTCFLGKIRINISKCRLLKILPGRLSINTEYGIFISFIKKIILLKIAMFKPITISTGTVCL